MGVLASGYLSERATEIRELEALGIIAWYRRLAARAIRLEGRTGKIRAVDRSFRNEAKSGNAGYFTCCSCITFGLHTLSVLRFRLERTCSCSELPTQGVSRVDRARKSAAS